MRFCLFFFSIIFLLDKPCHSQNFYDINTIQKIEITFLQPNWDYQLDTAKQGADSYILAAQLKLNGTLFDSVGIKYKGNSSYSPSNKKNPLHIELDGFKDQSYNGIKDIKLGNNYKDPSLIREILGYDILKNYMHCPQSNFAKVYINGVYYGIYSNTESIGKKFYSNHFYSSGGAAIKCNPIVNPSTNTKCNLKYINSDSSSYFNYYEIKSDYGWKQLVALCDTVSNYQSKISDNLDMDRVIWMLAFNNVMVNLDSYSGAFCQNYYLYKDNTQHYNPTIWDLNMCFGGFPYLGSGTSSLAQLNIATLTNLPINIHSIDVNWPLINIVNNNAQYKRMLVAHMRTISNEYIATNNFQTKAQQLQSIIDTSVVNDTCNFFNYTQFQNGLTQNISVGSYSVPGISNLLNARLTYLQGTTDFGYTTPTITAVSASTNSPAINSTVTITANVINTNTVYLGYRTHTQNKFSQVLMYDDGLHNDGSASDNIYGTTINITSGETEYYVYAENTNAGMFSPQRAQHEFYVLQTNLAQPNIGEVVINEFLASNNFGQTDENGKHEDWIELYNNTNTVLNLSGMYLSDDYSNPTKYSFPSNTIIQPYSFLMIWADEDNANGNTLHCNFKLLNSGEEIILSKGTTVLDSVSFGFQGADISIGRCPDGTGSFDVTTIPTFNALNCAVSVKELNKESINAYLFPSPANQSFTIETTSQVELPLLIINSLGQEVYKGTMNGNKTINTSTFSQGIYFIRISNSILKLVVNH